MIFVLIISEYMNGSYHLLSHKKRENIIKQFKAMNVTRNYQFECWYFLILIIHDVNVNDVI